MRPAIDAARPDRTGYTPSATPKLDALIGQPRILKRRRRARSSTGGC
jgi:hypothetical protein